MNTCHALHQRARTRREGGAVAVIFGLTVVILIGFAGLAVDLGRFFVIKAELQNAMDACALAAASQLRPGQNDSKALVRAVAYGRVFSTDDQNNADGFKNKANFQSQHIKVSVLKILFSPELKDNGGNYLESKDADYNTARYAKCEYPLAGLPIYFMRVLNVIPGVNVADTQTVAAMAVATLGDKICNYIPVGICAKDGKTETSNPPYGLTQGNWIPAGNKEGGGWFDWIDFEFQGGGSPDVWAGLTDPGECKPPDKFKIITEQGVKDSAKDRWNTRFGIYSNTNQYNGNNAPHDKTGYSYFNHKNKKNVYYEWANMQRDYNATVPRAYPHYKDSVAQDYWASFKPGRPWTPPDGSASLPEPDIFPGSDPEIYGPEKLAGGRDDRRLVVVPIMTDCSNPKERVAADFACVLMLNPFGKISGKDGTEINGQLEYLDLLKGSFCGDIEVGPRISVLVK